MTKQNGILIQVDEQISEIPVQIGELQFAIRIDEGALEKLATDHERLVADLNNITEEATTIAEVKIVAKKLIDRMLGEGAFDQIETVYPSIITISQITEQLMVQYQQQLEAIYPTITQSEAAQKYLEKKKQKKK